MSVQPADLAPAPAAAARAAAAPGAGMARMGTAPGVGGDAGTGSRARRWRIGGSLAPGHFVSIVLLFWGYVTLSSVLYAYSMGTTLAAFTQETVFAPWQTRVLQHALLFPPPVICYAASLQLEWRPQWWKLPLQVLMGLGFALLARPAMMVSEHLVARRAVSSGKWDDPLTLAFWLNEQMFTQWIASVTDFFLRYGFGLALLTGFVLYKRYRDTQLRVASLERQWTSARLAALRMQLSPHTLFNLLHTIRGNISWDPRTAQSMVVQLADLLRRLLAAGEREWSRLADELHFVTLYLELQQARFSDRLKIELPDAASLPQTWVPSLILQPLVENAVAHGLAGHDGPVLIRVLVEPCEDAAGGGRIRLRVENDVAPGRALGSEGIGLRNVRERLEVQLGGFASLRAGPSGANGWRSEIELPALRELPAVRGEPRATPGTGTGG